MRTVKTISHNEIPPHKKAVTEEARENQLINLAVNLAEKQLREGTASSQVISHYLKLASSKEKIEKEKLELEKELLKAKTESLQAQKRIEELYASAIEAMGVYSGKVDEDEDEEL